ncbi:MAG TPA: glycosyltransferase [Acidimicrobiales bacterium]|nr:glycosyltransferase [Acidimicrobiales bacterium]
MAGPLGLASLWQLGLRSPGVKPVPLGTESPPKMEAPAARVPVALVHDQLVQRGGAERVTLLMAKAFPEAPLFTSFYNPERTFPEFSALPVHPSPIDDVRWLQGHVRAALPFMARTFSTLRPPARVTLCSSTGWSHGVRQHGRKVVYCHGPARWLYQTERYLGTGIHEDEPSGSRRPMRRWVRNMAARGSIAVLGGSLRRWDRRAAASAHRYVVNSRATAAAVREVYGIEAEVLSPPPALVPDGDERTVEGLEPGFWLCVARLLPYKNVDAVARAVMQRPGDRLVVVGDGPERARLDALARGRVVLLGSVGDDTLRWLYRNSRGLVSASYEDYGLTPLEAASFGRPSAVLRYGGFLDTVVEDHTGVFFDAPNPDDIAEALRRLDRLDVPAALLEAHASRFRADRFIERLREIVLEELRLAD